MFIRLTFNYNVLYINAKYIDGFKPRVDHTQIWLRGGEIINVSESEEAQRHG